MTKWLSSHWVTGSVFMAAALLALLPVLATTSSIAVVLVYLCSPGYMLHQIEEHHSDRFRTFVNQRLFNGAEALTSGDVLVINLPLVWGVNLAALYAAVFIAPGWALMAGYILIVNALGHIGMMVRLRRYNPGLLTSFVVFLPLGIANIGMISGLPHTTTTQQTVAVVIALLIHIAIAALVILRARHWRRTHSN